MIIKISDLVKYDMVNIERTLKEQLQKLKLSDNDQKEELK